MRAELEQICTFLIDGRLFGIEVERVQEIIRSQQLTPIPLAPGEVRGLINLRGQIVPAIDVRPCLGVGSLEDDTLLTNVVLRTEDGAVSFLVDDIGDVLEVDPEAYEAPPDHLHDEARDLMRGIYKLDDGLLSVLSADAVIDASTRALTGRALLDATRRPLPGTPLSMTGEADGSTDPSSSDPNLTGDP